MPGQTLRLGDQAVPARTASSVWAQARGFRGRLSPPGHALAIAFDDVGRRTVDMVGVGFPLVAGFVVDGTVQTASYLSPWTGLAPRRRADTIIEVPDGLATVKPGMDVSLSAESTGVTSE